MKNTTAGFMIKRTLYLLAVILLVIAVILLTVYNSVDRSTKPTGGTATDVTATEDGKLLINVLYAGEITIPKFDVELNSYDTAKFKNESGLVTYEDENASLGIDVSSYQETIDWEQVKASGIEFAMIRAGYRGATRGNLKEDKNFQANYEGAKAAGLKVGVYFFSQAVSIAEAEEEAGYVLQLLQNKELDFPVVFDWEVAEVMENDVNIARTKAMSGEEVTSFAQAFCKKIDKAGYTGACGLEYRPTLDPIESLKKAKELYN